MASKVLGLLWNLAHRDDSPLDTMEHSLNAHIKKILDYLCSQVIVHVHIHVSLTMYPSLFLSLSLLSLHLYTLLTLHKTLLSLHILSSPSYIYSPLPPSTPPSLSLSLSLSLRFTLKDGQLWLGLSQVLMVTILIK